MMLTGREFSLLAIAAVVAHSSSWNTLTIFGKQNCGTTLRVVISINVTRIEQHPTYPPQNLSIIAVNASIRKGFVMTASNPTSIACFCCSALALAVTAIKGTLPWFPSPFPSISRMRVEHSRPDITGISISINTTSSFVPPGLQKCVVRTWSRASWPWFATTTS